MNTSPRRARHHSATGKFAYRAHNPRLIGSWSHRLTEAERIALTLMGPPRERHPPNPALALRRFSWDGDV
jgi:hypothetical protein